MSIVKETSEALSAAVATVEGIRVYTDPGAVVEPPGAIVGPPALEWGAQTSEPTTARFIVYVIVKFDDRALEKLWELVISVAEALDKVLDAAVVRADPSVYPSGGSDLPAYEITVEVDI